MSPSLPRGQPSRGGTSYAITSGHGITCLYSWILRLSGASVSFLPPFGSGFVTMMGGTAGGTADAMSPVHTVTADIADHLP